MIPTDGTHSPFDSDACIEWAIYCQQHNHNPDVPLTKEQWEKLRDERNHNPDDLSLPEEEGDETYPKHDH